MNDLIQSPQRTTLNFFDPVQMESVQRAANMFANSDLVPDQYKIGGKTNNPKEKAIANCVIAMNMASRMNADVLMVMQNLVIIYGRPSWSSAFLISSVNSSGRFEPLKYRITNKGKVGKIGSNDYSSLDNLECVAYTREKGSEELLESSPISIEMAIKEGWYTKNGSKWQTMPEQMLRYRAASFWTRAYAPEISMGMYTTEEVQDMKTVDAEYVVVDTKVENEISQNANKATFSMDDSAPTKESVKATPEQAFETAKKEQEPATEMFPETAAKPKRDF
ncbi:recombinase RecT [Cruoricaptor ignavus]|uniref:recombinase RecT n=1 Tax=Cruoricaptor ignavus TaxID=1118202 RepID=UPI00370D0D18